MTALETQDDITNLTWALCKQVEKLVRLAAADDHFKEAVSIDLKLVSHNIPGIVPEHIVAYTVEMSPSAGPVVFEWKGDTVFKIGFVWKAEQIIRTMETDGRLVLRTLLEGGQAA
jgi:hypothetical protein